MCYRSHELLHLDFFISWYTSIVSLSYDIFIQTGFSATFSKEEFSPKQYLRKAKII